MRIDWWTLGLQTVNLLVLLWILGRFLFRPMARIVADRQAEADRILAEAAAAREQAKVAAQAAEGEREAAAAARAGLLDAAREEAEAQRAALLDAARAEAQRLRDDAHDAIDHLRGEEEARAGTRAALLATDIAARLLQRLPGPVSVAGFLAGFEQAIAALPDAARAAIGTDGQPVLLKTASPLEAEEQAQCAAAIEQALGRPAAFAVETDRSLIAGLRLETPTVIVSNNLRADLDRIARELSSHDAG